jgi:hypothetical protein
VGLRSKVTILQLTAWKPIAYYGVALPWNLALLVAKYSMLKLACDLGGRKFA